MEMATSLVMNRVDMSFFFLVLDLMSSGVNLGFQVSTQSRLPEGVFPVLRHFLTIRFATVLAGSMECAAVPLDDSSGAVWGSGKGTGDSECQSVLGSMLVVPQPETDCPIL